MGYTTTFTGQFHCYRAEGALTGQFLRAIYDEEPAALAAFADWLTDEDDPRGPQVVVLVGSAGLAAFWRLFALSPEQVAYLNLFANTRRMKRDAAVVATLADPVRVAVGLPVGAEGAYFVGGFGYAGQDRDDSVRDFNSTPEGQPGLWCQWVPNKGGTAIIWNRGEKFYQYERWLVYLIEHFLAPWGCTLNGSVDWQGEDDRDRGTLRVRENRVASQPRIG